MARQPAKYRDQALQPWITGPGACYCQVRGIPYTLTWGLIPEGSIFTGWEALDFREACSLSHGLGSTHEVQAPGSKGSQAGIA